MKSLLHFLVLIPCLICGCCCLAQEQIEREFKVNTSIIPESALLAIRKFDLKENKINWYREESNNGHSFEAKFKFNKKYHSIEFDTLGQLEDIEIMIPENKMDPVLIDAITAFIESETDQFDFKKFQIQYSGEQASIINHVKENNNQEATLPGIKVRYEVVVKTKKDGQFHLYEYTFGSKGNYIGKIRKSIRNTDNLDH